MSHRRNRSSCRSDDVVVACEDDVLLATSSSTMLSGGGSSKRQRVEDALPEPGDQELSAVDCPWCQRGKLFVWSNAVMQSRGVGGPFPAYDVTGPVVCTYGKTCATSSLRLELMNNLMATGGGLTIEHLLWKISAAIHTHVSSCSSHYCCCHDDQQGAAAEAGSPQKPAATIVLGDDAASLYRNTMQLAVVTRRIGDPSLSSSSSAEEANFLLPPMLFYFLRCVACNTEDFIV